MSRPAARRARALPLLGILLLAACGSTESSGDATPAPSASDPAEAPPASETNDSGADVVVTDPAAPSEAQPDDAAATDPASTDAAAADPVQPAVLGGRALAEGVESGSEVETNLLPDLVVDDVGRGTKANLRNIFPSDRPVLVWAWAPH